MGRTHAEKKTTPVLLRQPWSGTLSEPGQGTGHGEHGDV